MEWKKQQLERVSEQGRTYEWGVTNWNEFPVSNFDITAPAPISVANYGLSVNWMLGKRGEWVLLGLNVRRSGRLLELNSRVSAWTAQGGSTFLIDIFFCASPFLSLITVFVPSGQLSTPHVDSEGRTPLHWAVDRGHLKVTEILLSRNADVNAKDNEGQTSLHYAAVCERHDFAELLVRHGADPGLRDEDGNSPGDLCSSPWNF
ncbi:Acyl-CoA-binding domain-containing protein 1 [Platanthera guangdongensis]|uniref:Acyl-CoA-binding domain-containing protein 1 n=1 Tax=Platanthera guangdongensis TaxID=2320717 RepID=A0ABR2LPK5_9ASPA